jgi:cytochrome-b5 reductase
MYNPNDNTKVSLLFANQTEGDILVREMLEDLRNKNPDRFKLHYTLDRPPAGWQYSSGFITEEMIKNQMPPPGAETLILACGPPPMIKFAIKPNLEKAGYSLDRFHEF